MNEPSAPLDAALQRIGDRWSLLVVDALLPGPRRFNELSRAVSGIAPNILSRRLRQLEREGVLRSTVQTTRPPRADYELTAAGRELAGALRLLASWGAARGGGTLLSHDACGTPVEAHWYCPTCGDFVEDDEATTLHRL